MLSEFSKADASVMVHIAHRKNTINVVTREIPSRAKILQLGCS